MDLEPAVYQALTADPALSALVGARCYPGEAPQDAELPYLVYESLGQDTIKTISGGSVGINQQSLRVDCYAAGRPQARAAGAAARAALLALSGTVAGVGVRGVFVEDEDAAVVEPEGGEGPGTHRVGLDLSVWFNPN